MLFSVMEITFVPTLRSITFRQYWTTNILKNNNYLIRVKGPLNVSVLSAKEVALIT